ncbi:hypothetical protein P2318_06335 [Myxococcaceae bacterium GXIMD 01537]
MRLRTLCLPLIVIALAACGNGEDEVELTDEPQAFVDRNQLLFDTEFGSGTYIGSSTFNTLLIENRGVQELEITSVTKEGPGEFTLRLPQELADGKSLRLASRKQAFIEVAFKPTEAKGYSGKLIVKTNDPKTPTREITLTAKGVTPQ